MWFVKVGFWEGPILEGVLHTFGLAHFVASIVFDAWTKLQVCELAPVFGEGEGTRLQNVR